MQDWPNTAMRGSPAVKLKGKVSGANIGRRQKALNMALSVLISPAEIGINQPFQLITAVALACYDFFAAYAGEDTKIKWPNDIYWRDRKAGGVLIENKFSGSEWKWAVVGVGININQAGVRNRTVQPRFTCADHLARLYDPELLARELHERILSRSAEFLTRSYESLLENTTATCTWRGSRRDLKKGNIVFETVIQKVLPGGELLTGDALQRQFEFGEVVWVI
jgi:BirA family biotin operon repressor/biotin-[acetyl-CoA-carboxylase] ligase